MHVGYVWMLLFVNYLGLLGAGMLLLACVRRYLDGKSFNTILIAGTITIIPIVALHLILIASITVFLLTANPSSNLSVFSGLGWSRNFPNLSQAWCFVEAQLTSTMLVSLMFSGLMQLYLPYAIFYHTEHNFDLPFLYPTRNSVIGIATFVLGLPVAGNLVKFLINKDHPFEEHYQFSHWHCTALMTDAVGYIWSTVTILCTFISLWLCIASIKMIKNANLVKKKGSKFIADELVGRAFMFGSITCAVDFLVCVNIFGAYMYPETGYLNYVPYITWYLFSSAGLAGLLILGSTRDVLPYLPVWLQPFSTLVQSQIRRIIQVGQEDLAVISPKIPVVFSVPVSPYPANFQSRPTNPEDGDRQDSVLLTMKLPRPDITE